MSLSKKDMETSSQSVSHLLQRWNDGDSRALDQLMPFGLWRTAADSTALHGAAALRPYAKAETLYNAGDLLFDTAFDRDPWRHTFSF